MTIANINIRQILLKRGTTEVSNSYTGPLGEVTMDTGLDTIRIHDGITVGGHIIPTQSNVFAYANIAASQTVSAALGNVQSQIDGINSQIGVINSELNVLDSNISILESQNAALTSNVNSQQLQLTNLTNGSTGFGNLIPSANVTYDLGSPTAQWRDLYVSSNTIYLGGTALGVVDGVLSVNGNTIQAATGNVTFNDNRVIGSGTASGDGNGYATLQLVPDSSLYANDQYLIIDPTTPNHIHIRAGGLQDASNAYLFLGGEKTYVKVDNGNGVSLRYETNTSNNYYYSSNVEFTDGSW